MILHSIVTHSAIFPPEIPQNRCISCSGRWFEGSMENGQLCISRIISTDPADYLRYSPGQRLSLPKENHSE